MGKLEGPFEKRPGGTKKTWEEVVWEEVVWEEVVWPSEAGHGTPQLCAEGTTIATG